MKYFTETLRRGEEERRRKGDFSSSCLLFSSSPLLLFCALLCLWFLPIQTKAQDFRPKWEWQNPLPQGNSIFAIRFAGDKLTGWAVGADGTILYTRDGGFNWQIGR